MNSALEIIYNRALRLDSNGNTVTDETLIRVGDAIAELIEADREYDDALRESRRHSYGSYLFNSELSRRLREEEARRASALHNLMNFSSTLESVQGGDE